MKYLFLILFVVGSLFAGFQGQNDYAFPVAISFATASITSTWVDVGDPIKANGFKRVAFPIVFAIGWSSNVRFRVLYQETTTGTEYSYPIATVGASSTSIENDYYEFNVDANTNTVIDFNILPVGYFQLQRSCSARPGTEAKDATLTSVKYILLGE